MLSRSTSAVDAITVSSDGRTPFCKSKLHVGTCQVLDYFGQGGHALTPFSFAVSTIHNQPDRYHTLDRRACTHARAMVALSPPGEVTSDAAARASTYLRIASRVLALEHYIYGGTKRDFCNRNSWYANPLCR